MRTRIMNQLQALAMNEGQRRKKKLWSEQGRAQLEKLPLTTWASQRRQIRRECCITLSIAIFLPEPLAALSPEKTVLVRN